MKILNGHNRPQEFWYYDQETQRFLGPKQPNGPRGKLPSLTFKHLKIRRTLSEASSSIAYARKGHSTAGTLRPLNLLGNQPHSEPPNYITLAKPLCVPGHRKTPWGGTLLLKLSWGNTRYSSRGKLSSARRKMFLQQKPISSPRRRRISKQTRTHLERPIFSDTTQCFQNLRRRQETSLRGEKNPDYNNTFLPPRGRRV